MLKNLTVPLLILALTSPAEAWATTAPQSQLRGIQGIDVCVQVIDHDALHSRSLAESLQAVAASIVRYQKLAKAAAPGQFLFVTLFLSKPPGDFCAPGTSRHRPRNSLHGRPHIQARPIASVPEGRRHLARNPRRHRPS